MGHPHERAESWSLAFHTAVSERVKADPHGVLAQARRNLLKMRAIDPGGSRRYLDRWERLLDGSPEQLLAVLTSTGQQARALRQCTPFAGVIAPRERWALFRAWRRGRDGAHAN